MVGSKSTVMKAMFLAEKGLLILFGWMFSQLRINSKAISHTKKVWKVLPFHINSNDAGCSKYSHRSGAAKASNGDSFNSVVSCFLRSERTLCILRYQT